MFNFYYIHQYLLLFLLVCISCQPDKILIADWSPELVTPLINSTITIADLIPEEGSTQYDESGFISLAVRDDSVYVLTPEDLLTLPSEIVIEEEQFTFDEIPVPDIIQTTSFNLSDLICENEDALSALGLLEEYGIECDPFSEDGYLIPGWLLSTAFDLVPLDPINFGLENFSSAAFIEGNIEIEITNNLPVAIEAFQADLSSGLGEVGPLEFINLLPGENHIETISLEGINIDNNLSVDILDLSLEDLLTDMVPITPEHGFEITFSITNINVSEITMLFTNYELESDTTFFDLNLQNEEGETHQIYNLSLNNAAINYTIDSPLMTTIKIVLSIPSALTNNQTFEITESIALTGEVISGSIMLADLDNILDIDLTTFPEIPYSHIPFIFEILIDSEDPITLTNTDYANINFSFSDLELEYLDGNFASNYISLGGDTVDVDLGLFDNFDAGLELEDPTFSIFFKNSFGLEAHVQGELMCYSAGDLNQAGFPLDQIIGTPDIVGGESFESIWNAPEGELETMISLPPHRIEYSASAEILDQGVLNYISSESEFLLGVEIECPLSLSAANISLHDTILFNQLDYDISQIEELILHFNIFNGFPLGTKLNLVLHDSINSLNLDTISFTGINTENGIILPATINPDNFDVEEVLNSGFLSLSSSEITNFLNSNKIIVDIDLNTFSSEDVQYIKLYSHYKCDLKLGVQTKLNIENN